MYNKADKSNKKPVALSKNTDVLLIFNTLDKLFGSQYLDTSLKELYSQRRTSNWPKWCHHYACDSNNPMLYLLNVRNHEEKTLLHIAANTKSFSALDNLLKFNQEYLKRRAESWADSICNDHQSISIDAIDSQKNSSLHFAAQKGHKLIVSLLLKKGAIFNAENLQGTTPEELAKKNHHNDITKLLQQTKKLFIAVEQNNLEKVKSYITKGAYINAKDKNGETPLHLASCSDHSVIAQVLIKEGANIEAIDKFNRTPLHFAIKKNKIEIVKLFLKNGAFFDDKALCDLDENESVNLLNTIYKLFDIVQSDNPQVSTDDLEMIHKDYKVDISTIINTRDNQGKTLLHHAVKLNEISIVQLLLENGAIFDAQDKLRKTAKQLTKSQKITKLLKSIEKIFKNVDNIYQEIDTVTVQIILNVRNDRGITLLHKAAESGKLDTVKWLLDHGAEVNATDKAGNTALEIAKKRDYQPLVTLLEDRLKSITADETLQQSEDQVTKPEIEAHRQQEAEVLIDNLAGRLSTEQEVESSSLLASSASGLSCSPGSSSDMELEIWNFVEREKESGKQKVLKSGKWLEVVQWLYHECDPDSLATRATWHLERACLVGYNPEFLTD